MKLQSLLEITSQLNVFRAEIASEAAKHADDFQELEALAILDESITQACERIELAGAAWNLHRRER